jgi:SAM-dependent methyltransferase
MPLPQLSWDISFLKNNPVYQSRHYGIPVELKSINYPIRLVRYWFMYHFLRNYSNKVDAIDVCEIGVDVGQMLGFVKGAEVNGGGVNFANWDAVDVIVQKELLLQAGYNQFYEVNLESEVFTLGEKNYDAMILLHVLEHLFEPEVLIKKLTKNLKPGGILIGGFPSLPKSLVAKREAKLRSTARKYGHVSVFSPERVQKMAADNGLKVEFLSGAFFMRKKGFFLENYAWWFKFNILFGGMFPSWPGETYWVLRKPN